MDTAVSKRHTEIGKKGGHDSGVSNNLVKWLQININLIYLNKYNNILYRY